MSFLTLKDAKRKISFVQLYFATIKVQCRFNTRHYPWILCLKYNLFLLRCFYFFVDRSFLLQENIFKIKINVE